MQGADETEMTGRLGTILFLLSSCPTLAQWSPNKVHIFNDYLTVTVESFWKFDSKVKGHKVLSGAVTLENRLNEPLDGPVFLLKTEGWEGASLTSEELAECFGGPGGLLNAIDGTNKMVKSTWISSNVTGQQLPPGHKFRYLANFLVPKKLLKNNTVFVLQVEGVGDVQLRQ